MAWTAMVTKGRVMGTKAPTQKNNRQCLETHQMWEEVNTNDSGEERLGLEMTASWAAVEESQTGSSGITSCKF